MLVIAFGTSKFHQYIYEKKVTVESDHKPLEILFKKPLSIAPQRIQRMRQYNLIVKYRPSDQLYIADSLSRASQLEWQADEFEVHLLVQISKEKEKFKREKDSDSVLSKLMEVILTGWSKNRSEVASELQDYYQVEEP